MKSKGEILINDSSKLQKHNTKEWSDKAFNKIKNQMKTPPPREEKEGKRLKKHKFVVDKCVLCGGISPNTFGECFCSYDLVMFSGDYKRIAQKLASIIKRLWKI